MSPVKFLFREAAAHVQHVQILSKSVIHVVYNVMEHLV